MTATFKAWHLAPIEGSKVILAMTPIMMMIVIMIMLILMIIKIIIIELLLLIIHRVINNA